jgi:TetR/AcrR family transcriptional repressor of nem operon
MASSGPQKSADTPELTLDVAERLVQVRGFNGFSYADIAGELNITKASLHYHFRSKAQLGQALVERYSARFAEALEGIDLDATNARAKLDAYVNIYAGVLRGDRMCLCGMLAAEYETLPRTMGDAVARFFQDNEAWLTDVLAQGRVDGSVSAEVTPSLAAQMILSGLEGAMLIARTDGGLQRFQSSAAGLIDALTR